MGKEATNELTSYLWLTARVVEHPVESLKKKNDADAAKNSHVKEDYRSLLPNSLHRTWIRAGLMQIIMFEYALPAWPTKTKLRMAKEIAMVSGSFVQGKIKKIFKAN